MTNKKNRHKAKVHLKSKYLFSSAFEEKKTCEYLGNLINSKFLHHKPVELFNFSNTVLGQKIIVSMFEKSFPELTENEEFAEWITHDRLDSNISARILIRFLKVEVLPCLSKRVEKLTSCNNPDIENRLRLIQKTFDLSKVELDILSFYFMVNDCELLSDYLYRGDIADFRSLSIFRGYGNLLLRHKRNTLMSALSELQKTQMIEKNYNIQLELTPWCTEFLSGLGKSDLSHEFFTKNNDEKLKSSDFEVSKDEMNVLDTLIKSKEGQNILFYGAPGSGKTSFAKSLATRYKKDLLTVKMPETDDHEDRLRAVYATVNLADRNRSLVLVDESDEILNTYNSFFFKSKTNKSWINSFLESHRKKIIWITNRSSEIDQSTLRRFSFSIEFKKLNNKNRLRVLKHELTKKGLAGYFDREDLNHLCKTFNVDAGGIVNAINTLKINKRMKKETVIKKISTVLRSHEKATCSRRSGGSMEREFTGYSLDGLNTSQNLKNLISRIQSFFRPRKRVLFPQSHSITMLLHGMPGTGKSEFVYYLGNQLGKEVLLKRSSEIQSKWVGETEQNIAKAFLEAGESNNILFFDEADTFLYPRKDAHQSWEKSFTNEILTQIESFTGIVIFATNDIEGIDHAALRRFKFKIAFSTLKAEGILKFYNTILRPLLPKSKRLSSEEMEQLRNIKNLTPGDFAVVKDQTVFMEPDALTHRMMIDSLVNEVRYKEGGEKVIGFGV